MIDGIRSVSERVDVVKSRECRTNRSITGNSPASNRKVESHLAGDRRAIYRPPNEVTRGVRDWTNRVCGQTCVVWICRCNNLLSGRIWICRRRQGHKLVGVAEQSQMSALATDIGGRKHEVGGQLSLDTQVPLLDVRPNRLLWNGNDRKWKEWYCSTISTDARVTAIRPSWTSIKP